MINALVIDVEYWYSPEFLKGYVRGKQIDQLPESILPILELLDKYNTHATFAILGQVAESHPDLVKYINDKGHEIASHCWSHKTLYDLGKVNFEDEISLSIDHLESIVCKKPIGFRAPSFSINNSTKWAFRILEDYGFKYDASIFPIETKLYGVPNAPLRIYRPSYDDITQEDPNGKLVEFPMTVLKIVKNIPFAGGFYFRFVPFRFQKYGVKKLNKFAPVIYYIHPWELYQNTPRLKLSYYKNFVTYHGIESASAKFEKLLQTFQFSSIENVLNRYLK
jgi:peptidoglycan-N-acetylglucosamine deacetylase